MIGLSVSSSIVKIRRNEALIVFDRKTMEFLSLHVNAYYCDYPFKRISRITCSSSFRFASHRRHIDSCGQNIIIRHRQPPKKWLLGIILQGKKSGLLGFRSTKKSQDVQKSAFPPLWYYLSILSPLLFLFSEKETERQDGNNGRWILSTFVFPSPTGKQEKKR